MPAPKHSIFMCYRRDDSADVVGRVYDQLVHEFGEDAVFRDVDSIPLGTDFRDHIQGCLKNCLVGLIFIGPEFEKREGDPVSRLADPYDHVRIECETLIGSSKVATIPCFVRGATSAKLQVLPESLTKLPFLNGLALRRDPDFRNDMEVLKRDLRRRLFGDSAAGTAGPSPQKSESTAAAGGAEPMLVFEYRPSGWVVRNIGSAPALDVLVAQKRVGGGWFKPVRIPELEPGRVIDLTWCLHVNDTGLGASYSTAAGTRLSVRCGKDRNSHYRNNILPTWTEGEITAQWYARPYVIGEYPFEKLSSSPEGK